MSRPMPAVHPLIHLIVTEHGGEEARHQGEAPSPEVWEAQADSFSNHLTRRLIEVAAEEIQKALGDTICLHKAFYGLATTAEQFQHAVGLASSALVQIESMRPPRDEEAPGS